MQYDSSSILLLAGLPVVAAFIGWFTNWAAVRLLYWPEERVGLGFLSWQGVVPRNAKRFATGVADQLLDDVLDVDALILRLDPSTVTGLLDEVLGEHLELVVADAVETLRPGAWETMSHDERAAFCDDARAHLHEIVADVFDHVQANRDDYLDLHGMIVHVLSGEHTRRLVMLSRDVAARELRFIEYYGAVFGFLVGVGQMFAFGLFERWWILPVVGGVVGLVTNYLALQMIFRPLEPKRLLGVFRYQGLFPKRQADIARDYSLVCRDEILTPGNIAQHVLSGPHGARLVQEIFGLVSARLDGQLRTWGTAVAVDVSPQILSTSRARLLESATSRAQVVRPEVEAVLSEHLGVADMIESRLASLSPQKFERLFRGIFEQDEGVLVALGGVLGVAVGLLQGAVLALA